MFFVVNTDNGTQFVEANSWQEALTGTPGAISARQAQQIDIEQNWEHPILKKYREAQNVKS